MNQISLFEPQSANISDTTIFYLTAERLVLGEFVKKAKIWGEETLGYDWFSIVMSMPSHLQYRGTWDSPRDPLFVIGSMLKTEDSPFWNAFEDTEQFRSLCFKVRRTRNHWAHFDQNSAPPRVIQDLKLLAAFAARAGLPCKDELVSRIKQFEVLVISGASSNAAQIVSAPAKTGSTRGDEEIPVRPRIGELWESLAPEKQAELNYRQRDLLDPQTGLSLRGLLGSEADATISRWLRLRPVGNIHFDPRDGASMAFIGGYPYFIGYLGESPKRKEAEYRGFLYDVLFTFSNDDVLEVESKESIFGSDTYKREVCKELSGNLTAGSVLQITDFGDLVELTDDGVRFIATLNVANLSPVVTTIDEHS
jgi:hypothetical protein